MNERAVFDANAREDRDWNIAGVDEAGRGPLAGPVVAAAVILPCGIDLPGVNDSKRLTPKARARAATVIKECALSYALGLASPREIEVLNIRRASLLAMARAVSGLTIRPQLILVDGCDALETDTRCVPLIGGDGRSQSVAAASILAKVARDELMIEMDTLYPGYGFRTHKGYPTKQHLEAIARLGPSEIHRMTFKGVV
ncbi:MAG: Ribonuclease HII [Firmicutes bacterium ADurb.Bin506]|jgi:ribonuclease HII|nr:MAG: Ribonuclease HII [Firmicutes bacterium ADurb.Bin506]